jgi:hypothetical protein
MSKHDSTVSVEVDLDRSVDGRIEVRVRRGDLSDGSDSCRWMELLTLLPARRDEAALVTKAE